MTSAGRTNWSGNVQFGKARFHRPTTLDELQRLIGRSAKARVVGSAHSFNDIADTDGDLFALDALDVATTIDAEAKTVTCRGGITHVELTAQLHQAGWALANLPSHLRFTVAGACATATHGSGDTNQGLAADVVAMNVVLASGDLVPLDPLRGAVNLGALGVVASMTLRIEPAFQVAQELYLNADQADAIDHLDEIMASAYSVSWFTDWQTSAVNQIWRKHRLESANAVPTQHASYHSGTPATVDLGPSGARSQGQITQQQLVPGPWFDRLPHVGAGGDLGNTHLQSEYFVDRKHGPASLRALAEIGPHLGGVIRDGVMSEIRTVAADSCWLSPTQRDSLALHLSWVNDPTAVMAVLPVLEDALRPFDARPHWGKLHTSAPSAIRAHYPRFDEFSALAAELDPNGVFHNRYLHRLFTG